MTGARPAVALLTAVSFACATPARVLDRDSNGNQHDSTSYAVAAVRSDIAGSDGIGVRSAGFACIPAGGVSWRDLAADSTEGATVIARTLSAQGLNVAQGVDGVPELGRTRPRYLIVPTIKQARIKICTPQWGVGKLFGGGRKLKGSITLTMHWDLYDTEARTLVTAFDTRGETEVSSRSEGYSSLIDAGLKTGAKQASDVLRRAGS